MPTTSRLAAAQDALEVAIAARVALANVAQTLGFPTPAPKSEHIYISGDAETAQQLEVTEPDGARLEDFTLTVIVWVSGKASYKEARDRCIALTAEVEAAVRATSTLSGTVAYAQVSRVRYEEGVRENEHQMKATMEIACDADLVN